MYYIRDAFVHPFLMDVALAGRGGLQVVPNFLRVFQLLPTKLIGQQSRPSHCPSPPSFQLVSSLLCQSQQEALSAASPSLQTAVFLLWPLMPAFVIRFHTDLAGNPRHPTSTVNSHVVNPLSQHSWTGCFILGVFFYSASSFNALLPQDC